MIRAIVAFFFFLFSLVLGGQSDGYASIPHSNRSDTPKSHVEKFQQSKLDHFDKEFHLIKNHNVSDKREDFLSIDDEDEDQVCVRKQIVIAKAYADLAQIAVFALFCSHPKNKLPFCSHLSYTSSYKYILQRVLRI